MRIEELVPGFAARLDGIDLGGHRSDALRGPVLDAFRTYAVLVVRGQDVSADDAARFAGLLGPSFRSKDMTNLGDTGQIVDLDDFDLRLAKANELWHVDMPVSVTPGQAALLFAKEVPSAGGDTEFLDLRDAWDGLAPRDRTALVGILAVHDSARIRRRLGFQEEREVYQNRRVAQHPIACFDPVSGRNHLYFGAHLSYFGDLNEEASDRIYESLLKKTVATAKRYRHAWAVGDVVVWNVRTVLHRATPYDQRAERRRLWRYLVAGSTPLSGAQLDPTAPAARAQVD